MLASYVIVFREVLEMALIVTVILAATKSVVGRGRWISGGIAAGAFGACLLAGFAGVISNMADGFGQEIFNASIMLIAVGMLAWHLVWMSSHGKEMAEKAAQLGASVSIGSRPLSVLAIMAGIAVLREGAEIALFMFGLLAHGNSSPTAITTGGIAGLLTGAVLGYIMYKGMVRIPIRRLFATTNVLILLIAAGMAAKAAGFLVQADLIPAFGYQVWNTSHILSDSSAIGEMLSVLVGYVDSPMGIQVIFYAVTVAAIAITMKLYGKQTRRLSAAVAAA